QDFRSRISYFSPDINQPIARRSRDLSTFWMSNIALPSFMDLRNSGNCFFQAFRVTSETPNFFDNILSVAPKIEQYSNA
ncbi:MAG TPA: hypothetical protein PKW71_09580, partial [Anaerohalosphaeraceae bacterium]|nr:hypothetical protein [Anaerohalosphaeraceae bacterium]